MDRAEQIKVFLQSHALISIKGLEREAGIPEDAIKKFLQVKRSLPQKHIPAIEKVLREYGYTPKESEK